MTRHLTFEAVDNFRDYGDYGTASGRRMRRGLLYRSAAHSYATDADLEKIAALNDEISGGGAGDLLTPRERAAVRFAEKLAVDHQKVDDALWAEVRAQFSEAEVIELVAHTTLYIGWGRFNEIVGIEPA